MSKPQPVILFMEIIVVIRQGYDKTRKILQALQHWNTREAVGARTQQKAVDIGEGIGEHGCFFGQLSQRRNPQVDRGDPAAAFQTKSKQQAR